MDLIVSVNNFESKTAYLSSSPSEIFYRITFVVAAVASVEGAWLPFRVSLLIPLKVHLLGGGGVASPFCCCLVEGDVAALP